MRLVDRGNETVQVRTAVKVKTTQGTTTRLSEPVTVRGVSIQPVQETEAPADTGAARLLKIIGSGSWPGGHASVITVTHGPYAGSYDQDGPARVHSMSPRTAHYVVRMTSRAEVVK